MTTARTVLAIAVFMIAAPFYLIAIALIFVAFFFLDGSGHNADLR